MLGNGCVPHGLELCRSRAQVGSQAGLVSGAGAGVSRGGEGGVPVSCPPADVTPEPGPWALRGLEELHSHVGCEAGSRPAGRVSCWYRSGFRMVTFRSHMLPVTECAQYTRASVQCSR